MSATNHVAIETIVNRNSAQYRNENNLIACAMPLAWKDMFTADEKGYVPALMIDCNKVITSSSSTTAQLDMLADLFDGLDAVDSEGGRIFITVSEPRMNDDGTVKVSTTQAGNSQVFVDLVSLESAQVHKIQREVSENASERAKSRFQAALENNQKRAAERNAAKKATLPNV